MRPKYSIIICTRDEEEGIAKVLVSIPEKIKKQAEIIVVDSSSDTTPKIAAALGAKVIRESKPGKGRAMRRGASLAKGDILIFLDGDGADPPDYIPKLLQELNSCELVLACRSVENFEKEDPLEKFARYAQLIHSGLFHLVGMSVSEPLTGFRAIRKEDWEKLDLKSDGFEIETEMNLKALQHGFRIAEVQIPVLPRAGGLAKSKFLRSPKDWFKIVKMVFEFKERQIQNSLLKG